MGNRLRTEPILKVEDEMKTLLRWSATLTVLALSGIGEPLLAQTALGVSGRSPRVPVTVAIVEEFVLADAPFVIHRSPGRAQQDVILLRADADEHTFSEAIRALLLSRRHGGDAPTTQSLLRTQRPPNGYGTLATLPWASRVLTDLRVANPTHLEGIGTVKAVEIWLPRQNRAGSPR